MDHTARHVQHLAGSEDHVHVRRAELALVQDTRFSLTQGLALRPREQEPRHPPQAPALPPLYLEDQCTLNVVMRCHRRSRWRGSIVLARFGLRARSSSDVYIRVDDPPKEL